MMDAQTTAFREEAQELLVELESSLLELEEQPDNEEMVAQVFRAMHTIKGSGAMFGFQAMSAFTHEVETVYDLVRNGALTVTSQLVSLSLQARDHIQTMLHAGPEGDGVDQAQGARLVDQFQQLIPASLSDDTPTASPIQPEPSAGADAGSLDTFRIRFRPSSGIFLSGGNPLGLLAELQELGPARLVAHTEELALLDEIDPEACQTYWDIILTTDKGRDAIQDVFIFVEDDSEIVITLIDDGSNDNDVGYKNLGELLIERGDISREAFHSFLASKQKIGEQLVEAQLIRPDQVEAALQEQEHVRSLRQQRQDQQKTQSASSIRVAAEKLDALVDLVGELVTVQSRLSQTANQMGHPDLTSIAEEVERLSADLRDETLNIRMLPIGSTFSKFKRLVRDLSGDLGKQIELETSGAETELDKTVIERLNDPLVHLIRNSLDHGIESPQEREAKGKPASGTVHLAAAHSGDSVIIEIRDDGAGLDRDRIRQKALDKGLITEGQELTDYEIYQLIFAPGFSTAQAVSDVSGRGVGMDVVKRSIEALRGSIDIQSDPGQGATIRLRIPLTLAIIESLLVQIGQERYVLPLRPVEECIELSRNDVQQQHGRNLVNVRGQLVPYIPLRERFAIPGDNPAIEQVVITNINGYRIGLVVDHVIGEHQTVIKSLGRMYRDVVGVSGATILGDGSVALIIDIPQMIQLEEAYGLASEATH